MNERIRELALEAGYQEDMFGIGHWDMPECRRFAQLIIKECGLIADVNLEGSTYPSFLMKQHFGIKE